MHMQASLRAGMATEGTLIRVERLRARGVFKAMHDARSVIARRTCVASRRFQSSSIAVVLSNQSTHASAL
jgi:hypothetical protein